MLTFRKFAFFILVIFLAYLFTACFPETTTLQKFETSIINMKEWGGTPSVDTGRIHVIKSITIHHGGEPFTQGNKPSQYLQKLQNWSRQEKKWIDIPYHYLIDLDGKIYEGRNILYVGDTNTEYDPTGHALICVVGNYEEIKPNEKQLEAIVELLTFLCKKYNIPPKEIRGHKDVASGTVCPGQNLYSYIANNYFKNEVLKNLETQ